MQNIIGHEQLATYLNTIGDGPDGLSAWEQDVRKRIHGKDIDALTVINANPFTIGHRYLVQLASKRSSGLLVLVIQGNPESGGKGNHENTGLQYPFEKRLAMAKCGLSDIPNVTILPSGPYMFLLFSLTESDLTGKYDYSHEIMLNFLFYYRFSQFYCQSLMLVMKSCCHNAVFTRVGSLSFPYSVDRIPP